MQHPSIGNVRGQGLMVGVEFSHEDGEPNAMLAKAVWNDCRDSGLLLLTCGTYGNVVRWIPPLVIDESQLDSALSIFEEALEKTARG